MKRTSDLDHVRQLLDYVGYISTLISIMKVIRKMIRYIPVIRTEFIMILTTLSMFGFEKQLAIYPTKGLMFRLLRLVNRLITRFLLLITDKYSRMYLLWNVHVANRRTKDEPLYFVVYTNTIGHSVFKAFCPIVGK